MRFAPVSLVLVAAACSKDVRSGAQHPRPDPLRDPKLASTLTIEPPAEVTTPTTMSAHPIDPGASDAQPITEAIAILEPTRGNDVRGTVRFRQTAKGLAVFTAVEGLSPGPHAYHVHLYGDCSADDATSAGPHFHFHGSSLDPNVRTITGNLGELRATSSSPTTHRTEIDAQLHGRFSIIGRSVVVHAEGNDPRVTPDGGAGARLACGVIGISKATVLEARSTAATR